MRATTEKGYIQKIRARMKQVGTYRPEFQLTIERLAKIYMRMSRTEEEFEESGAPILVERTLKNGTEVMEKNPLLTELDNLNRQALDLENALGLTPAALKKVNEAAMPGRKQDEDPLAAALGRLHAI